MDFNDNDFFDFNTADKGTDRPTTSEPPWKLRDSLDNERLFLEEMAKHGLMYNGDVPGDGSMVRFSTKDEKHRDKAGWFIYYSDGVPSGAFGDWRTGDKITWCAKGMDELTSAEREQEQKRRKAAQKKRRLEQKKRQAIAIVKMNNLWENAEPASHHQYLDKKKISKGVDGLRVTEDNVLLIPMIAKDGTVQSLQKINHKGDKLFFTDLSPKGACYTIPGTDNIALCEGFATGSSIAEATGWEVLVCFNSGNLVEIARLLAESKPYGRKIVVCADNDLWTTRHDDTEYNPGVESGGKAAEILSASLLVPEFTADNLLKKPTDFNDLAVMEGVDALRKQLTGLSPAAADSRSLITRGTVRLFDQGEIPEIEWIVNDIFQRKTANIVAAMGDAGKGLAILDLGLKVAAQPKPSMVLDRPQAFGHRIAGHGRVVYFTAEDSQDEVRRRLANLDPEGERFENGAADRFHIICLPDEGGALTLVKRENNEPSTTGKYEAIREALNEFKDLAMVVFDPMASFIAADVNQDPNDGAFVCAQLASMAKEFNCCVIMCHHMNKGNKDGIRNGPEARQAIRGTTAIVDGMRAAYCFWEVQHAVGKKLVAMEVCEALGIPWKPGKIFMGALVKCNGPGDKSVTKYARSMTSGLLEDVTSDLVLTKEKVIDKREWHFMELAQILFQDLKWYAEQGHAIKHKELTNRSSLSRLRPLLSSPFDIYTEGDSGARRYDIPGGDVEEVIALMVSEGQIVVCKGGQAAGDYLDLPDGPYATFDPERDEEHPHLKGGSRIKRIAFADGE